MPPTHQQKTIDLSHRYHRHHCQMIDFVGVAVVGVVVAGRLVMQLGFECVVVGAVAAAGVVDSHTDFVAVAAD